MATKTTKPRDDAPLGRASHPMRDAVWILLLAALLFSFVIEAFGGRYGIPSWEQLYRFFSIPMESPAEGVALDDTVTVTFFDVGQGDSVLIAQGGAYCLLDAGTPESAEALSAALDRMGVESLELVVLTHPHADHAGGMAQILQDFSVDTLLLPPDPPGTDTPWTLTMLTNTAQSAGTRVLRAEAEQTYAIGQGILTVLQAGFIGDSAAGANSLENDASLCLRYTLGAFSFLDTGDAEADAEAQLVGDYRGQLHSTLFKGAHHGSSSSNSEALLNAVSPQLVCISCGVDNEYGHPHAEVLTRLEDLGIQYARTDLGGTLTCLWQDGELTFHAAGKDVTERAA